MTHPMFYTVLAELPYSTGLTLSISTNPYFFFSLSSAKLFDY